MLNLNRPFLLAGLIGLATLFVAVVVNLPLRGVTFAVPEPFSHPIIALEFGASSSMLETLLGAAGQERTDKIWALMSATQRDTLFVITYMLFLLAFAGTVWRQTKKPIHLLLCVLALGIGLADIAENTAIKSLLLAYDSEVYTADGSDFSRVRLFAWLKWAGLAVYFAVLVPYLWACGWIAGRALAIVAGLAAVLGLVAVFAPTWIERYVALVFIALPLTVAYCFVAKKA